MSDILRLPRRDSLFTVSSRFLVQYASGFDRLFYKYYLFIRLLFGDVKVTGFKLVTKFYRGGCVMNLLDKHAMDCGSGIRAWNS